MYIHKNHITLIFLSFAVMSSYYVLLDFCALDFFRFFSSPSGHKWQYPQSWLHRFRGELSLWILRKLTKQMISARNVSNVSNVTAWKFLGWGRANHFVATIWRCTTPPDYKMRCRPLLFCYKMAIENLPMILCCQFDFTNFATKWRWILQWYLEPGPARILQWFDMYACAWLCYCLSLFHVKRVDLTVEQLYEILLIWPVCV